ncbi:hypothetical protein KA037_00660 [Patescibacteria group bacterium]|nr:hypothetical protein [Patescibacteria group bacterium]
MLNMFSNIDTIPYINKIIDIGSRKGKSGRMQLIETSNVSKLIGNVTATEESDEEVFK